MELSLVKAGHSGNAPQTPPFPNDSFNIYSSLINPKRVGLSDKHEGLGGGYYNPPY